MVAVQDKSSMLDKPLGYSRSASGDGILGMLAIGCFDLPEVESGGWYSSIKVGGLCYPRYKVKTPRDITGKHNKNIIKLNF
jgi:hypothetical protein